jgi:hypothetical protein
MQEAPTEITGRMGTLQDFTDNNVIIALKVIAIKM